MKRRNIKVNRRQLRDSLVELKIEMELCSDYLNKLMAAEEPEAKQIYADLIHNVLDSYKNEIPKCLEEL